MATPETHPSLILQLADKQNELAWGDFLIRYEPFLKQMVRRQGTPDRHVADVTQQLCLEIARSVQGWRSDGKPESFRRWLTTVARHVVIKFMHRERKQVAGQGGSEFLSLVSQHEDVALSAEHRRAYQHELILWAARKVQSEFRESSWKAFWLTHIEERDVASVAAELKLSAGAIYMSRSRILARIRAVLAELDSEGNT